MAGPYYIHLTPVMLEPIQILGILCSYRSEELIYASLKECLEIWVLLGVLLQKNDCKHSLNRKCRSDNNCCSWLNVLITCNIDNSYQINWCWTCWNVNSVYWRNVLCTTTAINNASSHSLQRSEPKIFWDEEACSRLWRGRQLIYKTV